MTTPEYAIIPPIHGTVEVAIPGNPPTLLRVTGVDWSPTERVLRVAVAATEFSTENAPGLGLVDGLPLGAASLRHEAEPPDPRGEPLVKIGPKEYEKAIFP